MNKELEQIISDTISCLDQTQSSQKQNLEEVKAKVIDLQKQLLNASILAKPRLEAQIKADLKSLELEMLKLTGNDNLELNYLVKLIKENYD